MKIDYDSLKTAFFFDVGNTLMYPYPSVADICLEVLESKNVIADRKLLEKALINADRFYDECYASDDTFWASESRISDLWSKLYALVFKELEIIDEKNILAKSIYCEFGKHSRWKLYEDVEEILTMLKGKNKVIGIISNWDSRLVDIFLGLGLSEYFDFIISSANVKNHKPSPEIFELALERAKVSPDKAVHIGDHYYADILGARSVGIAPILIDRFEQGIEADCPVIQNLIQLTNVINL